MPRRHMVASLLEPRSDPRPMDLPMRHPVPEDAEALANLMLDAYRGTTERLYERLGFRDASA